MTEHQPFIDAILWHPDDDRPRKVYADFLEENGQGERGAFIRVQCELAKTSQWLPTECDVCGNSSDETGTVEHGRGCYVVDEDGGGLSAADENPRWLDLRRRERELLRTHWRKFSPDLNCHAELKQESEPFCIAYAFDNRTLTAQFYFCRGLVESISCIAANWLRHGKQIVRSQPIREVRLTDAASETYFNPHGRGYFIGPIQVMSGIEVANSRGQFSDIQNRISEAALLWARQEPCPNCEGEGGWYDPFPDSDHWIRCGQCKSTGSVDFCTLLKGATT